MTQSLGSHWTSFLDLCQCNPLAMAIIDASLEEIAREGQNILSVAAFDDLLGGRAGAFDLVAVALDAYAQIGLLRSLDSRSYAVDGDAVRASSPHRQTLLWSAAVLATSESRVASTLVLATPRDGASVIGSALQREFHDLRTALRALIASAASSLVLASPFWDVEVAEDLATLIARRMADGVSVRILARRPRSDRDRDALMCFARLTSFGDISVKVLDRPSSADRFGSHTFHFKAAVADASTAYIGSANFNLAGFDSRWELGVILRDRHAASIASLLEALAAAAEAIFVANS